MHIKIKSTAYKIAIYFFCAIVVVVITPFLAAAQGHPLNDKPKTKKTTRVFYGQASYYANTFNGRRTANGEIFDQKKFTCACNVLPLGTWIKVTNLKNGRSAIVKVNDRIHPKMKRIVGIKDSGSLIPGHGGFLDRFDSFFFIIPVGIFVLS